MLSLAHTDTPQEERTNLFIRKLEQCCYIFDFTDPMSELKAKEIKRAALNEILDYISCYKGVLSEPVYPEVVRMVSQTHTYTSCHVHMHRHMYILDNIHISEYN